MDGLLAGTTTKVRHGGKGEGGFGSKEPQEFSLVGGSKGRQWLEDTVCGSKVHLLLCVTPIRRLHSKDLQEGVQEA